ncbi:hypothetical protein RND71_027764 [Anisodus tanguticus]|uniref:Uncharacterized protein n=1 Tax=Anisodus tanguticus TaxID=243964 RepID=A0AAE1RIH2_9SOLA|nr:hypothetical protein RND71_027764 [Anisodus tanguticus]
MREEKNRVSRSSGGGERREKRGRDGETVGWMVVVGLEIIDRISQEEGILLNTIQSKALVPLGSYLWYWQSLSLHELQWRITEIPHLKRFGVEGEYSAMIIDLLAGFMLKEDATMVIIANTCMIL